MKSAGFTEVQAETAAAELISERMATKVDTSFPRAAKERNLCAMRQSHAPTQRVGARKVGWKKCNVSTIDDPGINSSHQWFKVAEA